MDMMWQYRGEEADEQIDEYFTVNAEHVGLYFILDRQCSQSVDLSALTLTLEPQLAVLIRLHCLKCSTFSVITVSPILTNCTVVVAVHHHAGYTRSA